MADEIRTTEADRLHKLARRAQMARDATDRSIARLRSRKDTPKWLLSHLSGAHDVLREVSSELSRQVMEALNV